MTHRLLKEDKLPPKLPVRLSTNVYRQIDVIDNYNQKNATGINQWYHYIDTIIGHISNPAIAWDYAGILTHFPNGAISMTDFNSNVGFIVRTNNLTNQAYVYVFKMDLKPEEFGLKVPPTLKENKNIILTESQLRNIIRRTILDVLYN